MARPSRDLEAAQRFYIHALGFQLLGSFTDHHGIDGIILGCTAWPYHLEFTRRRDDPIRPNPTDEDLVVLYLPEPSVWREVVNRCQDAGASFVRPSNPFWDRRGLTLQDPDGYRIVLQHAAWDPNGD